MASKAKFKGQPKATKGKPKKWKRGHSAISNPQTTRFREAARGRFFSKNSGIVYRRIILTALYKTTDF